MFGFTDEETFEIFSKACLARILERNLVSSTFNLLIPETACEIVQRRADDLEAVVSHFQPQFRRLFAFRPFLVNISARVNSKHFTYICTFVYFNSHLNFHFIFIWNSVDDCYLFFFFINRNYEIIYRVYCKLFPVEL